jgi:hypothetical protein
LKIKDIAPGHSRIIISPCFDQGMVVAILFCLINNEVMVQLKRFCGEQLTDNRNPQSMAMTQYTVRNNNQLMPLHNHNNLNHNHQQQQHQHQMINGTDEIKFAQ